MTFREGTVVKDICTGRLGTLVDEVRGLVSARPFGGGPAWVRETEFVREATPLECRIAQSILLSRRGAVTPR